MWAACCPNSSCLASCSESFNAEGKWNFDDCGIVLAAKVEAEKEGSDSGDEDAEEPVAAKPSSKSKSKRPAQGSRRPPQIQEEGQEEQQVEFHRVGCSF